MNKLTPVRFDGYMLKGGSTKPWCVTCIDEKVAPFEEVSCVVKLFKPKHIEAGNSIGKEFICNILAREFDLDTPEAFIVNVHDERFKSTLNQNVLNDLSSKYVGNTFCSKLVGGTIVSEALRTSVFSIADCALLFAFDCLILNADRGGHHEKANLMINDDGFILIDHELSLHFMDGESDNAYDTIMENFTRNTLLYSYRNHLFYGRLKSYRGSKKNLFDTFEEYLNKLDLKKINKIIAELASYDVSVGSIDRLMNYLYTLKQNSHKFCTILLSLIA